jgi:hypothetical protein
MNPKLEGLYVVYRMLLVVLLIALVTLFITV